MPPTGQPKPPTPAHANALDRVKAWGVHVFTASGALAGIGAIVEIHHAHWRECFILLTVATLIDSFDGMLARWARVKEVLPHIDGALLDNMVDYFTYVLVPAVYVLQSGMVPEGAPFVAAAAMVLSSAYQFSQVDAKTADHYFKGWPSYWNILVFYLAMLEWPKWINLGLILLCAVLVFVPMKYVYPSRTVRLRGLTIALTLVWGMVLLVLLAQFPHHNGMLLYLSLLYIVYYTVFSVIATVGESRGRPRSAS